MTQSTSDAIARAISECFLKIRAGELPRRLHFDLEPQRSSGRKVRLDDLTPVIRENVLKRSEK